MQVDVFIQVRMASSRVPRKAFANLGGKTCLQHVIDRVHRTTHPRQALVCTSAATSDDPIADFAARNGTPVFRGSVDDCLDRFWQCAVVHQSDVVVRICGDSPLASSDVIDGAISLLVAEQWDYVAAKQLPVGTYVEVFTSAALQRAHLAATDRSQSDDLTYFVGREEINSVGAYLPEPGLRRPELVLALNRPEDLEVLREIFSKAPHQGELLSLPEAIDFLDRHPDLAHLNAAYRPKPTSCDTRLDISRIPERPAGLLWCAPIPVAAIEVNP